MNNTSNFCPVCGYGELVKQEPEFDIIYYECDCCNYRMKERYLQLNTDVAHKDILN